MIEVVFGDSACCGLKMAQQCRNETFSGGTVSVIVSHPDGGKPTEEEIRAEREIEESMRLEWENATPMGGSPVDVYGFEYRLSIGDISENVPGEKRRQVLEGLYSIYPEIEEEPVFTAEMMQSGKKDLKEVCGRILAKESVRIWYSNQPDELCGMYWFMTQLSQLELQSGQVTLVHLPDWETDDTGNTLIQSGWGGVKLGDWHRHLDLQKAATSTFCKNCADHWQRLQAENFPLRAMLNGRLVSAPEALYDEFINREIANEADEFNEAMLIGRIMEKYKLGISDAWIAHRIERMIYAGSLIPITEHAHDSPIYHRKIKKVQK